ncbi:MAG: hypothetical protein JHD16_09015 [Solirubrobacteraceae bacterium]|nr:hypothetical protein [Solirubrobacteraceae bacterium]
MSTVSVPPQVPSPRLVLVMAGAAGPTDRVPTALELAAMPQLAGIARTGRVGRLHAVASHLPVSETSAAATALGTIPPMALDPGAVAIEALGRVLASDESCTVVVVLDHHGDPAPALDVERAAATLRSQLRWQRVAGVTRGNQILIAGAVPSVLPQVDGLRLEPMAAGFLPSPILNRDTVVVAADGSMMLGVASLLGATAIPVNPAKGDVHDPVPGRLRATATTALLQGAHTVVVETRAPLLARRGQRDDAARQRLVAGVLSQVDRELIGPLRTATSWVNACISVTADLSRRPDGTPVRGDVPIAMAGPRAVFMPEPAPLLAPPGTTFVPAYSERGVADQPAVSTPFTMLPAREAAPLRRFRRDPVTGRTARDIPAAA